MTIKLSDEAKKQLISSIRRYFVENLEQEIGDLKADLLLDYFLKELGPTVYNKAISDAQAYFQEKTADLDGSCYEPELTYWR
ncbi:MAG: DUF2164 family protein [Gemmatimonadales bacterium]|nr:DUF2164 family protein [Gemmatimonadales bacterium]NIN12620.1 DUF2164 family protein [Gemmatimonadales bacterium]NIR02413.1 DUF2164 family protein [Gemmatimonadales bacterium]NIS66204.1 DUF2164 family protein [Gemmatimonadales bacterium]